MDLQKFLETQEDYEIGFKNVGVVEWGGFDPEDFSEGVKEGYVVTGDIFESDMDNSTTYYFINKYRRGGVGDEVIYTDDEQEFVKKLKEIALGYWQILSVMIRYSYSIRNEEIIMGYTSGVAEQLYKSFKEGTYLALDTYPKMTREEAVKAFTDDYSVYDDEDIKNFIEGKSDSLYDDDNLATLYELVDGSYRVDQSEYEFVAGLSDGGYHYDLNDEGEAKQQDGFELDEDDFNYIRLGVAGEHIGDISVWYDLINETVGGRDFADKSVSQYTDQIDDYLETTLDNLLYEINHN